MQDAVIQRSRCTQSYHGDSAWHAAKLSEYGLGHERLGSSQVGRGTHAGRSMRSGAHIVDVLRLAIGLRLPIDYKAHAPMPSALPVTASDCLRYAGLRSCDTLMHQRASLLALCWSFGRILTSVCMYKSQVRAILVYRCLHRSLVPAGQSSQCTCAESRPTAPP